jgi:hypothetical protein
MRIEHYWTALGQRLRAPETRAVPPVAAPREQSLAGEILAWGWLPALSMGVALGVLAVAFAYLLAGQGSGDAPLLYWLGLLAIFVPVAIRLAMADASRGERLGVLVLLALGLYLVRVLRSPLAFTGYDELLHWRTAGDILQSGHLFNPNPLLPVSPLYPGLESVTTALVGASGLPLFAAGVIVVGAARLLLVLSLFLFYEQAGDSHRLAGLATLLYMTNQGFISFDAQFAYESLALPLAVAALCSLALARSASRSGRPIGAWCLAIVLLFAAVVATHHVTSYALVIYLAAWSVAARLARPLRTHRPDPLPFALLLLVMVVGYLMLVATQTVNYLSSSLLSVVGGLLRMIAGEGGGRQLFHGAGGQPAPLWEQLAGYASTLTILLGLGLGGWRIWRSARHQVLPVALGLVASLYPLTLAMRFVGGGTEISGRAVEFLSIAIAFVVAVALFSARPLGLAMRLGPVLAAFCALVLFVGGIALGTTPGDRLPGPYLASADMRSIDAESLAAAGWARAYLGPNNGVAADRINSLLMASYGEQRVVTDSFDGVAVPSLFFAPGFGPDEVSVLADGKIRYLVVDRRLSRYLPRVGIYYELSEPGADQHRRPMNPALLAKFDALPGASRQFDSGDIQIYDVQGVLGAH